MQTIIDLALLERRLPRVVHAGLLQQRGPAGERSLRNGFFGGGSIAFMKLLEDWRAKGDLEGLELTT